MKFTNGDAANIWLSKMTIEQLNEGFRRGARKLAACPDPDQYATGGYSDRSDGHPDEEMRESVRGWQHYGTGFAKIRLALETAMVDTYQELVRRRQDPDISNIKMIYHCNWKIPR